MAGDWIKLEHATPSKPEIYRLSRTLGISRGDAFLLAVEWWIWLDRNSCNGNVTLLLRRDIDDLMHCPGFAAAMEAVGWLSFGASEADNSAASVPNFERHNGKTAKDRALSKDRMVAKRALQRYENVTPIASPEKRREEKREVQERGAPPNGVAAPTPASPNAKSRATRLTADWRLPEQWKAWATEAHAIEPQKVVRLSLDFRDYWVAKPGQDGTKLDWEATWRRWVRRECGGA